MRPREISVMCKIPNCICDIYNTNESQSAPEYSGSIYKTHIFSSQENFRAHLSSNKKYLVPSLLSKQNELRNEDLASCGSVSLTLFFGSYFLM